MISVRKNWILPSIIVCLSLLGYSAISSYSLLCMTLNVLGRHRLLDGVHLSNPQASCGSQPRLVRILSHLSMGVLINFPCRPTVYVWLVGSVYGSLCQTTRNTHFFNRGADVIITASMIFYLDLRLRMNNVAKGSHPARRCMICTRGFQIVLTLIEQALP